MGLTGPRPAVNPVLPRGLCGQHPKWGWRDSKEERMSQQNQPGRSALGPKVMFWMWMGTIVIGFAIMLGVVGSGR